MAIEIERKFRVTGEAWRGQVHHQPRIAQVYLNHSWALATARELCSVRSRITGESANLNIKSREAGARRQEFEYPIPLAAKVTDCLRFYNMALAARPFHHWTAEEKSC